MNIIHPTRRNCGVVEPANEPHLKATNEITKSFGSHHRKATRKQWGASDSPRTTCSDSSSTEKSIRGKNYRRNSRRQTSKRQQKKSVVDLPDESLFAALDCEMVGIGPGGHASSVARVTLIDWDGGTLFDEYIQQTEKVTDYRTFVSGITEQHLNSANMSLSECREHLLHLLDNRILVGHALKNDLRALNITHPWWLIRDTAKYEPFMQVRFDDGILWPRKLKDLVHEKLHQDIQIEGRPHSSYEDALAALDLYRLVRTKWEKVIQYKVEKTNQIQQQQHHPETTAPEPAAQ